MKSFVVILFVVFLSSEIVRLFPIYPWQPQVRSYYPVRQQFGVAPLFGTSPLYPFPLQFPRSPFFPFIRQPQFGIAPTYPYFGYPGPQFVITHPPTTPTTNQCPPQTVACIVSPCRFATCPRYPQATCRLADPCQPCGNVVFHAHILAVIYTPEQCQL